MIYKLTNNNGSKSIIGGEKSISKKSRGGYVSKEIIDPTSSEYKKCAPNLQFNDGSCLPFESLYEIGKSYNLHVKLGRIDDKPINLNEINTKKKIVTELTNRLGTICDDQLCWLEQDFVKALDNKLNLKEAFRPKGPEGRFTWLSNFDIEAVMNQYEEKYDDFMFMGAFPIDFDNINWMGRPKADFGELEEMGKTRLGYVINYDHHWQGGSHWVALYIDLKKYQIYYFDSYGSKPRTLTKKFITRIIVYLKNKYKKLNGSVPNFEKDVLDIRYNKIRHQFKHSECGTYSMNFILRLLNGEKFSDITKERVPDEKVNECRTTYFRY